MDCELVCLNSLNIKTKFGEDPLNIQFKSNLPNVVKRKRLVLLLLDSESSPGKGTLEKGLQNFNLAKSFKELYIFDKILCTRFQALMLTLLVTQTFSMELFCNFLVMKAKIKTICVCLKLF